MYIDFKSDESYTPNKISIKAGTVFQDLKVLLLFINFNKNQEIHYVELKEPSGWYIFPLRTKLVSGIEKKYVKTMNI